MESLHPLIIVGLVLVWIAQAYILWECWKDETFPKHVRIIYTVILLFPIIGGYIYYRDRRRTASSIEHLNRASQKNPWEL